MSARALQIAPLSIHGAALLAMAERQPEEAAYLTSELAYVLRERERLTRRMLQALDAYWLMYEGLPKGRRPRGKFDSEDWWFRFERYRSELTELLAVSTTTRPAPQRASQNLEPDASR